MRLLSLVLFYLVLVPIGWTRKLLRSSPFTQPAYERTSAWQSARSGAQQPTPRAANVQATAARALRHEG